MGDALVRRVYGTETEYGLAALLGGDPARKLTGAATGVVAEAGPWLSRHATHGFVTNGGRIYRDAGDHPEYASPECGSLLDAVAYDKAGDRLVAELVRRWCERAETFSGEAVHAWVVKNNTDAAGAASFGYHENYLVSRHAWDQLDRLAGLLATRPVVCGAGRVCAPDRRYPAGFSLTQRTRFLCQLSSLTTTDGSRGLLNERDEPLADQTVYGRLHIVSGDANRAQWSTWVKLGVVALALRILEADPDRWPEGCAPENPLTAVFAIDRDVELRTTVPCNDGRERTAVDVQRCYRDVVARWADQHGLPPDEAAVLDAWSALLDDLAVDPDRCTDRVDWIAKRWLVDRCTSADSGLTSRQRIDVGYHRLGPGDLAAVLERRGWLRTVVSDEAIATATVTPPPTRAGARAAMVQALASAAVDHSVVDWTQLSARHGHELRGARIDDPFATEPAALAELLEWVHGLPAAAPAAPLVPDVSVEGARDASEYDESGSAWPLDADAMSLWPFA